MTFVRLQSKDDAVVTRVNGRSAVGMDMTRQSVGNTLSISQDVATAVEEFWQSLTAGVQLIVTTYDGTFTKESINEVLKSIGLATISVVAAILAFFGFVPRDDHSGCHHTRGACGHDRRRLALLLATGMVVDGSIVVIENIVCMRKQGMGAFAAAATGANEVFFAFIPIPFLSGQAGDVFSEFGFVLAFAVIF